MKLSCMLTLALAVASFAPQSRAQARITSVYRWQEVQEPIRYPSFSGMPGQCNSISPRYVYDLMTQTQTGFWGATPLNGRAGNGRPATLASSFGTATAAVASEQFWPGDAVLGNTVGFGQITLHPRATLTANTPGQRCATNNFFDARSGMTIAFQTDRTEIFAFYGTITRTTNWAGLTSANANLVCNGVSMFNVGIGSHDYTFTLGPGQNCLFSISASSRAETWFTDNSTVTYDVVLKSDG